jgi:hypothetical protein
MPGGGFGGLPTDPDCVNETPADGESCDESGMLCQSGEQVCVCFGQGGDDPTWNCFDGGGGLGGRGMGGFGNGGRAQAGNGGRAQAGGGGFGNFGGRM